MKNWVIQGLRYDINPSPQNYIKSRWSHFHFCKKEDPTITASLYLDNLASEVNKMPRAIFMGSLISILEPSVYLMEVTWAKNIALRVLWNDYTPAKTMSN